MNRGAGVRKRKGKWQDRLVVFLNEIYVNNGRG